MDIIEVESRQKQLVGVIQGVHEELRYKVQKDPDAYLKTWESHCTDPVRQKYAAAMHSLATKVWTSKENIANRIDVIRNVIQDYFFEGGFQRAVQRMLRKYAPNDLDLQEQIYDRCQIDENPKLKILDVGSCYNPFSVYKNYEVTAVDLCPATVDVLQCDFVTVRFGNEPELSNGSVTRLPQEHFDVVIFCLLLEYLPDVRLRLAAVHNAYQALKENGILIVVTPDSKHEQKNMHMIQQWKKAFTELGFDRTSYAKHQHLHCIGFRKLCEHSRLIMDIKNDCGHAFETLCSICTDRLSPMLFIQQDKHDYVTKFEQTQLNERSVDEQLQDAKMFNELPDL